MAEEVKAFARVSVEVEVEIGPYGPEWTIGKIKEQAHREAADTVRHVLGETAVRSGSRIRVLSATGSEVVIETKYT